MESSFNSRKVSRLSRADFTIRSNIVRTLSILSGPEREIIDEFWNKCMLTRIINVYVGSVQPVPNCMPMKARMRRPTATVRTVLRRFNPMTCFRAKTCERKSQTTATTAMVPWNQ